MYTEIDFSHAKVELYELLRGIKRGQSYTITLNGEPVADLIPSEYTPRREIAKAINQMQQVNKIKNVTSRIISHWIQERRKWS